MTSIGATGEWALAFLILGVIVAAGVSAQIFLATRRGRGKWLGLALPAAYFVLALRNVSRYLGIWQRDGVKAVTAAVWAAELARSNTPALALLAIYVCCRLRARYKRQGE